MIYLVGSLALRLMALTFLFPVIARITLSAIRPGHFAEIADRPDFAFRVGLDAVMVILGLSLLFRSPARALLGQADGKVLAFVRAMVMAALAAGGIGLGLVTLRMLGAIPATTAEGPLMVAVGFWVVFVATCVFPGWYSRRLWSGPEAPPEPQIPMATPRDARFLDLMETPPAPGVREPLLQAPNAPGTAHMGAVGWLVTFLVTGLFAIIVTGGVHGSTTARFLPNEGHVEQAERMLMPLGALCAILLLLFTLVGPRPTRHNAMGSPFWRTVTALVVFYFGFYISAAPALQTGIPDLLAQTNGGPGKTVTARVVAREQDYRRHKCNRTAFVRMDVGEGTRQYLLCDIPEEIWSRLHRGQLLRVRGHTTPYGFHYAEIGK